MGKCKKNCQILIVILKCILMLLGWLISWNWLGWVNICLLRGAIITVMVEHHRWSISGWYQHIRYNGRLVLYHCRCWYSGLDVTRILVWETYFRSDRWWLLPVLMPHPYISSLRSFLLGSPFDRIYTHNSAQHSYPNWLWAQRTLCALYIKSLNFSFNKCISILQLNSSLSLLLLLSRLSSSQFPSTTRSF